MHRLRRSAATAGAVGLDRVCRGWLGYHALDSNPPALSLVEAPSPLGWCLAAFASGSATTPEPRWTSAPFSPESVFGRHGVPRRCNPRLYMAPEALIDGETAGPASDLYALAAVDYFLVTGTHVFTGANLVETCSHHLHTQPDAPSDRLGRSVAADFEGWKTRWPPSQPPDSPPEQESGRERAAAATTSPSALPLPSQPCSTTQGRAPVYRFITGLVLFL